MVAGSMVPNRRRGNESSANGRDFWKPLPDDDHEETSVFLAGCRRISRNMLEKTLKAITGDDVRIFPMHSPDHRRAFLGSSAHVASVLDLEQIRVGPREVRAIEWKSKPKKPMARSISTVASAGASLPISKSVDASTRTMVTSHAMMSAVGRIRRHLLALGHVADALAEAWGEDLPSDITDKRWRRGRWRHPGRESSSGAGASSTPDEEFYRDTLPEKDEPPGLSGAKTGEVAVAHSKALQAEGTTEVSGNAGGTASKVALQWKWNFQETLQAEVALPEVAPPGVAAWEGAMWSLFQGCLDG